MRRMARAAHDWISVDSLADVFARGILAEPFRWAEIEQLVYSASEWSGAWSARRSRRCRIEVPRAAARPTLTALAAALDARAIS